MAKVEITENKQDNNLTTTNQQSSNNSFKTIGGIILVVIVIAVGVYLWIDGIGFTSTNYKNTKWTSTDGYTITINTDSCYLSKDGNKLNNVCKFTENSNGSGIPKLEICDSSGLDCDSIDLTMEIHSNIQNKIRIFGQTFYMQ